MRVGVVRRKSLRLPKPRLPSFEAQKHLTPILWKLGLAVGVVALISAGALYFSRVSQDASTTITRAQDGLSREEIQASLDKEVEENMMVVSVLPTLTLSDDKQLTVGLENDSENTFAQQFTITQDDEIVFESKVVMPGERIESVAAPKAQIGSALIKVQALNPDSLENHGSPAVVQVSITRSQTP